MNYTPATTHYHTLTDRELRMWNHCNPDMAKWRQRRILDAVADEAERKGKECYLIYDAAENMLGQGCFTDLEDGQ